MSDISLNPNLKHCGHCRFFEWEKGICINSKSDDFNGPVSEESISCEKHEEIINEDKLR